jgi:hypothetical protein
MPLDRWPIPVTLTLSNQFTAHSHSIKKYGIIFGVTLSTVGRYSLYKRKSSELWLMQNPELQVEVYL